MAAVYLWAIGVTVIAVAAFLVWLGLSAQSKVNPVGNDALIGETGIVRKAAGFRSRTVAEVRGENWWCRVEGRAQLTPGDEVRITGVDQKDMILVIEPTGRG